MGFLAGLLIRKGFSFLVRDAVPNHILEPPALPVSPVCPSRWLLTFGQH